MFLADLDPWRGLLRQAEDEGAGGGQDGGDAGGGDGDGGDGAAAAAAAAQDGAPAARWWEGDRLTDAQRAHLTHKGLTVDDPIEAAARLADMHANAERRLGVPADQIMTRPKKDQKLGDWMRENAGALGLPDKAEAYDPAPVLKDLPKGVEIDQPLLDAARQAALDHGLPPDAFNAMVGVYAQRVGALVADAETQLANASAEMMTQLGRDWGDQVPARIAVARRAAEVLADKAGLDPDALQQVSGALAAKTGDANVIKLFAAVGEMLGEDRIAGTGQGSGSLGTTPAEARQQLSALRSPEGAYYKASAEGNAAELRRLQPEIERLSRIAAQS